MTSPVERFEKTFADWLGAGHAFTFWKGRVAMYAILRALGVGEGDEVILPGYTCVVVANPVKYVGAKPVYVDIEPVTYNIDPAQIEAKITPRTRLIVAQHTYGYPAEMDAIMDIANRHGLPVVEDSCLAVGSTYKGRRTGTFGIAAYWSFQWNKTFTTGMGGMATTDDPALAEAIGLRCRQDALDPERKETAMLALQRAVHRAVAFPRFMPAVEWLFRKLSGAGILLGGSTPGEDALQRDDAFFKRMSRSQARAGLRRMQQLDANIRHRRHMKRVYDGLLAERGWPVPEIPDHVDPVLVRYPVRVADKPAAVAAASKRFIELGTWFESPLHQAEAPLHVYDYQPGMCPEAERAVREVVNLPTHPRAGERIARRCVDLICEIGPAPRE